MRRAQHVDVEAAPPLDAEPQLDTDDTAPVADGREVLEILDAEAVDDGSQAVVGIRNGVLAGAAIWAAALLALAAISYL